MKLYKYPKYYFNNTYNLKKTLSKFPDNYFQNQIMLQKGFIKCGKCLLCKNSMTESVSDIKINNIIYYPFNSSTCDTKNIIYAIRCSDCNLCYIGESKNNLKTRMYSHLNQIKHNKNSHLKLYNHFINEHNLHNLTCFVLDTNSDWNKQIRLRRETFFIDKFTTINPKGLNERDNKTNKPLYISTPFMSNLNSIMRYRYYAYTSHKNIKRIFHKNKF